MSIPLRPVLALLFAILLGVAPAAAETKPKVVETGLAKPTSLIFIGNSFFYYNNGINGHFTNLLKAAGPEHKMRVTMVTIGGSGLDWHDVNSYFRPNAIGRYSFDDSNNITFNKIDRLFDVAVMMDCSQCPIHPQLKSAFARFARKDAAIVRAKGTVPVFFMSWAYADKPEMTAQLAEAYTRAGNANHALVIPAGLAFARAHERRPDLGLYAPDKRHPSLAGTYLAACTTYAAILGRSPVGLKYTAGLDQATVDLLQNAAWDTVREYYGTKLSAQ